MQRDSALFSDFLPFALQDYESLKYSNDKSVKDAFLRGDIDEPDLRYGEAELVHANERIEDLNDFESVILTFDDDVLRRAYLPKITEVRTKLHMLDAAAEGDDARVRQESVALYGEPQKEYFNYALRELGARISVVEQSYGDDVRVEKALQTLKPLVQPVMEHYPWDDIALPGIKEYKDGTNLAAPEIQVAFTEAFASHGIEGWQAVIDAPGERISFNTNLELRTVFIPSDEDLRLRKYPLTQERIEAIIAHEVGTHVVRRENGIQSPLRLLSVGLDHYLRAEEGIAVYMEQLVGGSRHFNGGAGYLSVGWAFGVDGTPRTFRGLFDVLVAYMFVAGLEHALIYKEPINIEALEARVVRNAWARCVRTYRGTSGRTPGCCFTKDIVYLEGNVAIWRLVTEKPEWKDKLTLGKYDPTNPEHVAILRELGMLD
jgi:hypothetical protein